MSDEDDAAVQRIAEAYRTLRWKLNDEGLDALDQLMEHLLSLEGEERRRQCEQLIEHVKEIMENQKPVN